ncbi:hypothetical protein DW66_2575 [Pseudomonas putida]|nr:hypothetical protein DW66_2575 [Pseudomonas putida]
MPPLPAASLRFIYVFQGAALRVGGCFVCGEPRIRSIAVRCARKRPLQ